MAACSSTILKGTIWGRCVSLDCSEGDVRKKREVIRLRNAQGVLCTWSFDLNCVTCHVSHTPTPYSWLPPPHPLARWLMNICQLKFFPMMSFFAYSLSIGHSTRKT